MIVFPPFVSFILFAGKSSGDSISVWNWLFARPNWRSHTILQIINMLLITSVTSLYSDHIQKKKKMPPIINAHYSTHCPKSPNDCRSGHLFSTVPLKCCRYTKLNFLLFWSRSHHSSPWPHHLHINNTSNFITTRIYSPKTIQAEKNPYEWQWHSTNAAFVLVFSAIHESRK